MAKYMLLIYGDEQRWEAMSKDEWAEIDAGHTAFQKRAGDRILAAGQLEASSTATTLRTGGSGSGSGSSAAADGPAVTDGPFLETKEVLGGFYLVDVADLDEAVALTRELAEVRHGHSGVEIKPLVEHDKNN